MAFDLHYDLAWYELGEDNDSANSMHIYIYIYISIYLSLVNYTMCRGIDDDNDDNDDNVILRSDTISMDAPEAFKDDA